MTDANTPVSPKALYDNPAPAELADFATVAMGPPQEDDKTPADTIRIMWGQPMLPDILAGRYRAIVCGVNDEDNANGIISSLVKSISTSQWRPRTVTSYARMFSDAVSEHASEDAEPYILKYDLDTVLVLALLRPKGRDHFTLAEIGRGFKTVSKMLQGRKERLPVAAVSFLGAKTNKLRTAADAPSEPSFEAVLREMHSAGFRGDVYPSRATWAPGDIPVHPCYPFPGG